MKILCICVIAAVSFVWLSSASLPAIVASNFGEAGVAKGYMSHGAYVALMLGLVLILPLLLVAPIYFMQKLPISMLNFPHKEYWFAPKRRVASFAYLLKSMCNFSCVLLLYLCFVHWLVVNANATQPPRLSEQPFIISLLLFLGFIFFWLFSIARYFRRR